MQAKIVVVGLGRSGIGAAKLLHSEGHEVIVIDSNEGAKLKTDAEILRNQGIKVELGKPLELLSFRPWLEQLDSVIISPAIPSSHKTLNELRKRGVVIKGEMELAWEKLKHFSWIGITGTNGKTTVTHMLNHVLESNQLRAPIGGNVGNAASELALKYRNSNETPDWLIMELSSYQLETATDISPQIGIWTNLTPDHLERHGSIEIYGNIKRKLLENSETPIYNADDKYLSRQRSNLKPGVWISTTGRGSSQYPADFWLDKNGMIIEKEEELFHSSVLKIPGRHNIQNLLIVTAAARKIGLTANGINHSFQSFLGIPHRLENLGHLQGISFFNDSKATNYASAEIGLIAVSSPVVVIAGGQAKDGDPSQWLQEIHKRACGVVLYGDCRSYLKDLIYGSGFKGELHCSKSLAKAVNIAISIGIKSKAKSILLSPACASFDQYKDYEERGDHFREIVFSHL